MTESPNVTVEQSTELMRAAYEPDERIERCALATYGMLCVVFIVAAVTFALAGSGHAFEHTPFVDAVTLAANIAGVVLLALVLTEMVLWASKRNERRASDGALSLLPFPTTAAEADDSARIVITTVDRLLATEKRLERGRTIVAYAMMLVALDLFGAQLFNHVPSGTWTSTLTFSFIAHSQWVSRLTARKSHYEALRNDIAKLVDGQQREVRVRARVANAASRGATRTVLNDGV